MARCRSAGHRRVVWGRGAWTKPSVGGPLLGGASGTTLDRSVEIGLGTSSLDRPSGSRCRGGEDSASKMIRHLFSSLTGRHLSVFDEAHHGGMHPHHDIQAHERTAAAAGANKGNHGARRGEAKAGRRSRSPNKTGRGDIGPGSGERGRARQSPPSREPSRVCGARRHITGRHPGRTGPSLKPHRCGHLRGLLGGAPAPVPKQKLGKDIGRRHPRSRGAGSSSRGGRGRAKLEAR